MLIICARARTYTHTHTQSVQAEQEQLLKNTSFSNHRSIYQSKLITSLINIHLSNGMNIRLPIHVAILAKQQNQ